MKYNNSPSTNRSRPVRLLQATRILLLALYGCAFPGAADAQDPINDIGCPAEPNFVKGVSSGASSWLHPTPKLNARALLPSKGARKVEILWSLYATSAFQMDELRALKSQEFAVRFTPTSLEFMGPSSLAVAGCLGDSFVVEIWELRLPIELSPIGGGAPTLVPQSRASVRQVYSTREETGQGFVTQMAWNRGKERSLFCLFRKERDLFELTWPVGSGPGSVTEIATVGNFPLLAGEPFDYQTCGDHSLEGYVYMFGVKEMLHIYPSLVLRDFDRDGGIDTISTMQHAEMAALELKKMPMWHEYSGLDTPW